MIDLFGFKRRAEQAKQVAVRANLTEQFNAKKTKKYIRNVHRLRIWLIEGHTKGVALVQQYLEDEGLPPPTNVEECDRLLEVLGDVE